MLSERIHVYGIRHHGPGSARSLLRALAALRPDCLLIEGPPDAEPLLPLAAHQDIHPPVALLVYVPTDPRRAAFYPFSEFSPEWQAIRYGLGAGATVRFMDLPQFHQLVESDDGPEVDRSDATTPEAQEAAGDAPVSAEAAMRLDPLGRLARAAGYSDGERWWDALVESRREAVGDVFAVVAEAMTALREDEPVSSDPRERQREAHMRKTIRAAAKEGFERIAVVCGAWHAPALAPQNWPAVKADNAELKGLPKVKTEAAWTPWTYRRLASRSGYGAGVTSPAWYELLWRQHDAPVATVWMTRVARLMRERDLDASSAHVIEAVRLGETLSAMRGRALAGLEELEEAALSVLCGGQTAPMRLIRDKLVIGDRLGAVPADAPMAPLQRDLTALQKRLRLPATAEIKRHDFDLRKPMDLERSRLLHRLNLLGVPWGQSDAGAARGRGTFHEHWTVQWDPGFVVSLIDASRYGGTVHDAAAAKTSEAAGEAQRLSDLTALLGDALLADLPSAVERLVSAIQQRASGSGDVQQLMAATPPLAHVTRYGDVRQTDVRLVSEILTGIIERVCIGLPAACSSLDDEAASQMRELIDGVDGALATLDNSALRDDWLECLARLAARESAHALLRGRGVRVRHDAGRSDPDQTAQSVGLALSRAADRAAAASWLEGFLSGSGLVLIHDTQLWRLVDQWLVELPGEEFTELLPLLRRTFATFPAGERRQMGERVRRGAGPDAPAAATAEDFNHQRAARVLPLIAQLLGKERPR